MTTWACLHADCTAAGPLNPTATGKTDDATRHGAATGHSTMTSERPASLARMVASVRAAVS